MTFLADLERRPRLHRKFQSPPERSNSQKSWLCWSSTPALLELSFHGEKLSPERLSNGRIELPRDSNQHQIEILLEQNSSEIPEFWIEIQESPDA